MRKALVLIAICLAGSGMAHAQIRGRVVMGGAETTDVLVSLVSENGQIMHQTFTSSRGDFSLDGGVNLFSLRSYNPMYIVIDQEGYLPYRQRILQSDLRSGGLIFTIYLEEEPDGSPEGEEEGAVDVRQLSAEIPEAALEAYNEALDAAEGGNHTQAVERLELAVRLAPDYYDAWVDLGALYLRLGRPDDGREAYRKATEANPGGAIAHLNLGILHYQQADRERQEGNARALDSFAVALEWLEKSVQLDPTASAAGFYLGATFYRLEQYPESEDWLQRAVSMGGEHVPGARSMLINVYSRQSRYVAAHQQAVLFLEEFPDAPEYESIERVKAQLEAALGVAEGSEL